MKIQGLSDASIITDFRLQKNVGKHSVCVIKIALNVKDENFKNKNIGEIIKIEKDFKIVFKGILQAMKIRVINGQTLLEMELYSISITQDKITYTRIFQNPKKTYKDILNTLEKDGLRLECDANISQKQLKKIVVQIEETNFEFLKRIATCLEMPIWVLDDRFVISLYTSDIKIYFKNEDIISFSKYINEKEEIIKVESRKYLEIGSKVSYNKEEYLIKEHTIIKEYGEYINKYTLINCKNKIIYKNTKHELKELLSVCEGIVEDNEDPNNLGRLKVSFREERLLEVDPKERVWCDFKVMYSMFRGKAGISFTPEKGDLVEVSIYEDEMIVSGCVRKRIIDKSIQEPKEKFIKDPYGNTIKFNEEGTILYNDNANIKITKENIELKIGDSLIQIKNDKILFKSSKLEFESKDDIKLKSKNIELNSKGKVEIKGQSIELK